jgi:aromatic-amino-acid transaminase
MTSLFSAIAPAPLDPIIRLWQDFTADPRPNKLNLVLGVYSDASGNVPQLRAVQTAERRWIEKGLPKTYRPLEGTPGYRAGVQELLFGPNSDIVRQNRVTTIQSIGGTGALKIGADMLARLRPGATVAISDPSWENHRSLFEAAGFPVVSYPYYSAEHGGVDFDAMQAALDGLAPGSIVILHACCHNPTGSDLTAEQWRVIVDLVKRRDLIPFLDIAYQGFGDGLFEDAIAVQLFVEADIDMLVASSFSKSFSLYGERVGALTIVAGEPDAKGKAEGLAKRLVRTNYSNPPTHGAALVETVLASPELRADWERELSEMRERIDAMRRRLADSLQQRFPERGFDIIKRQKGMFSYSGLTAREVERLRADHEIYAVDTGRICVAALNEGNIDRVIGAIEAVLSGSPAEKA